MHLTLVAGGDVLPGHFLAPYLVRQGEDYPFVNLAPHFRTADIGLVNLETPLSWRGKRVRHKTFTFRSNTTTAFALVRAGINAVSLANNHILDYGEWALADTLTSLDAVGIAHAGAGANETAARQPALLSLKNGLRVAILSYSLTFPERYWATEERAGTALARLPTLAADISAAKGQADLVVVCFHWGGELQEFPREYQSVYGHAAIDAGAGLVVGTHPHILQGFEWYRDGLIAYSLGNLVFGGGNSKRAVRSALLKVGWSAVEGLNDAAVLPLNVDNRATQFQPQTLTPVDHQDLCVHLEKLSAPWGVKVQPQPDGWAKLIKPENPPALKP